MLIKLLILVKMLFALILYC